MAIIMPNAPASSSRRSGRNGHVENDPIEENTQDEPVNGNRTNGNTRANGNEEEDQKEVGWTTDTFVGRPLDKSITALNTIKKVIDSFKEVIKKIEDGMGRATETARAVGGASPDDDYIEELEAGLQRAIEQRQMVLIKIEVLEQLHLSLRQGEQLADANALFEIRSSTKTKQYMTQSKRAKFKEVKEYIDFRSGIWEINHPDQACPPISRFLPKADDDGSDEDDFEMGGTTQTYRCPVTMLPLKDAVTSTTCGHSFSRLGIDGIFANAKRNTRSARCPVAGCNVILTKENLRSDKTLQKRADEFEQRKARREDESDDEDDVDISQAD